MRTADEIVAKIDKKQNELLGFWPEVLIEFLTFDDAKPFLKPEATADEWSTPTVQSREIIIEKMRDYMEFAWGKVENHRGISASRSVEKMEAWIWLLGDDLDLDAIDYAQYGAPKLAAVCERYGFPIPDGAEIKNMINGRPCEPGCGQGCGH